MSYATARYVLPNGVRYAVHCNGSVATLFPDGVHVVGSPQYGGEHVERARSLGYTGDAYDVVDQMTHDHDLLHSIVAYNIDGGWSHALRWATDGVREPGRIPIEERLVFLAQRAINSGRAIIEEYSEGSDR